MLWVPNPSPPWLFPKKSGSCGPRKTHEKICQGPCLSSSKLSEGGPFGSRDWWVGRLRHCSTAGISMIIQAIGKGSKVIGYHIVSPDFFGGSNLTFFLLPVAKKEPSPGSNHRLIRVESMGFLLIFSRRLGVYPICEQIHSRLPKLNVIVLCSELLQAHMNWIISRGLMSRFLQSHVHLELIFSVKKI